MKKTIIHAPNGREYILFENGVLVNKNTNKKLKQSLINGYYGYANNIGFTHLLLYKEFIGEIPKGFIVIHANGNKLDNSLDNLKLVDRRKFYSELNGDLSKRSPRLLRVSDEELLDLLMEGKTSKEIASITGYATSTINKIKKGDSRRRLFDTYGPFPNGNENHVPGRMNKVDILKRLSRFRSELLTEDDIAYITDTPVEKVIDFYNTFTQEVIDSIPIYYRPYYAVPRKRPYEDVEL